MNLCRPDTYKSCAACCGLYNVSDGTRLTLYEKLAERTDRFADFDRTPDAMADFEEEVRTREITAPHDDQIHVCEFTGFVDSHRRTVGCMLHPCAPGNNGLDLRGMCHYGSLACKSFYCPAWDELPLLYKRIIIDVVDDWHLYGLVVTDVDFVSSLFEIVGDQLGAEVNRNFVKFSPARWAFLELLHCKDSPQNTGYSTTRLRLSRYYMSLSSSRGLARKAGPMDRVLDSLQFTFGHNGRRSGAESLVWKSVYNFVSAYRQWVGHGGFSREGCLCLHR